MKIVLKPSEKTALTGLREELTKAIRALDASSGEVDALNERKAKLEDEIATLEAKDDLNDADAAALAAKRLQLPKIEAKIEAFDSAEVQRENIHANQGNRDLLRKAEQAVIVTVAPTITDYTRQAVESIRPYCMDERHAWVTAFSLPAVQSLIVTYATQQSNVASMSYLPSLRRQRALLDELLTGELKWRWNQDAVPANPAANPANRKVKSGGKLGDAILELLVQSGGRVLPLTAAYQAD